MVPSHLVQKNKEGPRSHGSFSLNAWWHYMKAPGGVRDTDLHPGWPIITGVLNQHQACNNISASVIPLAIKAFTRLRFCVWCLLWFFSPAWWRDFSLVSYFFFHWTFASLLTLSSRCGKEYRIALMPKASTFHLWFPQGFVTTHTNMHVQREVLS